MEYLLILLTTKISCFRYSKFWKDGMVRAISRSWPFKVLFSTVTLHYMNMFVRLLSILHVWGYFYLPSYLVNLLLKENYPTEFEAVFY